MAESSETTETRIGPDGKPRLYSKMSKEKYNEIVSGMPKGFEEVVEALVSSPDDDPTQSSKSDRQK